LHKPKRLGRCAGNLHYSDVLKQYFSAQALWEGVEKVHWSRA